MRNVYSLFSWTMILYSFRSPQTSGDIAKLIYGLYDIFVYL